MLWGKPTACMYSHGFYDQKNKEKQEFYYHTDTGLS